MTHPSGHDERCEFCGAAGCHWSRHPEAQVDVQLVRQGRHPDMRMWRDDPRDVPDDAWHFEETWPEEP